MPSFRTRQSYDRIALAQSQTALETVTQQASNVAGQITELTEGNLELDAIKTGGVRLVWDGEAWVEEA